MFVLPINEIIITRRRWQHLMTLFGVLIYLGKQHFWVLLELLLDWSDSDAAQLSNEPLV